MVRGAADLGAGDDPVRLRVALEAVGQAEPLAGQPVEHLLAEVPERRVAEVVGERGRLDHVRVAAAQLVEQVGYRRRRPAARRSPGPPAPPCRLWVSRLCTSRPAPPGLITWVTPPSRAKNGERRSGRGPPGTGCGRPPPPTPPGVRRAARAAPFRARVRLITTGNLAGRRAAGRPPLP